MEGAFNEDPNLDESLDPVGQYSAVHCLLRVFRGISIEDEKLVAKVVNGELEQFTVQEIAIFSTVVRGKERSRRQSTLMRATTTAALLHFWTRACRGVFGCMHPSIIYLRRRV